MSAIGEKYPRCLEVLTGAWDTSGGQALRALLWSLYNDRCAVPLWSALTDIDAGLRAEIAAMMVQLNWEAWCAEIGELLRLSGEMERIDTVPLKWPVV